MKTLLTVLKNICDSFPLKEKIIIVDSYPIGEDILEAFMEDGNQAINLSYSSVRNLAIAQLELVATEPCHYLDPSVGVHFTYQLLKDLKEKNQFSYFNELEITPSLSNAIFQTIRELRLAGFTKETLPIEDFLSPEKGMDMVRILSSFEELLTNMKLHDEASIYQNGLLAPVKKSNPIYILQSNLTLAPLEEQFLTKILSAPIYKLPLEQVHGITIPERSGYCSIAWGEATPLSFLYQQETKLENAKINVFSANTEEIEVKNLLAQLKKTDTKLDDTVVYYTNSEPYVTLFYHLFEKTAIPITFGEGLPISFSRPGRFVLGLIEWMQSNYHVPSFLHLLNEGLLELDEEAPSKARIAKLLRDSQIGWSQERYDLQLDKEIGRLHDKMSQTHDEQAIKSYEKRIRDLSWLKLWFKRLFENLPKTGSSINYQSLLKSLSYMLKKHCKIGSALDQMAKTALIEEMTKILPYSNEMIPSYEAFEKVTDLLFSLKINKSRPQPGHLHVASFKSGIYHHRPNVFVIGLDNRKFPGESSEDPLLLDTERIRLNKGLALMSEKGQGKIYTMLQVLARSKGSVTVSYSAFDINENRTVSPAHLLLQCYRMMTGNPDADFKDLKKVQALTTLPIAFEIKDFWHSKLTSEHPPHISEEMLEHFINIKKGTRAVQARNESLYSSYDGLVQINEHIFDPRKNKDLTMNAGKLETLAKCPYKYFLREILGVRPVEDISYEPNRWLDPAMRGTLLHSIFETFYKKLVEDESKPSLKKHKELILQIAEALINQQKEVLPPPNERVFERETQDIYYCCEIFLREEEEHCKNHSPLYFEYAFGIGDIAPALITLPSGEEVNVSGKIDRVDVSSSGKYHIIDYKTGSTYEYGTNASFKGGRQLQHFIYALAIEQHLRLPAGIVEESSYYFPTSKGEGHRAVRKQNDELRTNGFDLLEKLIDVIKSGHFSMTDDVNDCKFCEFQSACRRSFYNPDILEQKQMDPKAEGLTKFRGVRSYE